MWQCSRVDTDTIGDKGVLFEGTADIDENEINEVVPGTRRVQAANCQWRTITIDPVRARTFERP